MSNEKQTSENQQGHASLVGVGSSAMPKGFRVYVCTDCQEVNVKKDNQKVRVGFCDSCDHPLWNSAEDVPHD